MTLELLSLWGSLTFTPDSFSDGGSYASVEEAVAAGLAMVEQGALIVDVGGESTRPGASPVSIEEELRRVEEVVRRLAAEGVCVSVDTRHAEVAQACIEAGASIINDVTGFRDPEMVKVATSCDAGLVAMHMKGDDPRTMQDEPCYDDVVDEVATYLKNRAEMLEDAGIERERICLDPGPWFRENSQANYSAYAKLPGICSFGISLMVAVSRKSYIGMPTTLMIQSNEMTLQRQKPFLACELWCVGDSNS